MTAYTLASPPHTAPTVPHRSELPQPGTSHVFPMLSFWAVLFWVVVGALLTVSFIRVRSTFWEARRKRGLDDDDIQRILETGVLVRDDDEEPLDLREIEEQERRFWEEERWDEAEEW